MKSGILPKRTIFKRSLTLKLYFTVGTIMIFVFLIIYTNSLLKDIKQDVQIVPDLYAKFISLPADVNLESFLFQYFMSEIVPKIDYPIILADSLNKPYAWENTKIDKITFEDLSEKDQINLKRMMNRYESQLNVIPLKYNLESDRVLSYVYFGESSTMKQLRYMPYIEIAMVVLFILLGFYVFSSVKKNEENILWIGLAKETAHQFGSPLSSLMGWRDVLAMKLGKDKEMLKIINYMQNDLERLNKIASRFGKVGSTIKLQPVILHDLIQETIDFFQRRLPSFSQKITINFISKIKDKNIKLDPDLIKWTLENMIKNSLDAMQKSGGEIRISAFEYKKNVYIQVKDNGKGIPKSMFKRIFSPGVTTKNRGWGLGLSLAKRIVEEFHRGKIHVESSELNKGTTFEVIIPED